MLYISATNGIFYCGNTRNCFGQYARYLVLHYRDNSHPHSSTILSSIDNDQEIEEDITRNSSKCAKIKSALTAAHFFVGCVIKALTGSIVKILYSLFFEDDDYVGGE